MHSDSEIGRRGKSLAAFVQTKLKGDGFAACDKQMCCVNSCPHKDDTPCAGWDMSKSKIGETDTISGGGRFAGVHCQGYTGMHKIIIPINCAIIIK